MAASTGFPSTAGVRQSPLARPVAGRAERAKGSAPHHVRLIMTRYKEPQPSRSILGPVAGLVASCGCVHEPS